ncbi:MAG: winged helix-turn-helix transcriptional regulator [Candidatus Bathyarchaeota archaeon]|nr:winged helix-turn-helix transcriptional regulator [Candidatus Bathyarchaeota archaeon]
MVQLSALSAPLEIRMVLRGLGNEQSLTVFLTLLEGGEMSFSELKTRMGVEGSALTYQLQRLMESALVEHYYRHELGNDRYSFYSVTEFGRHLYGAMVAALIPETARESLKAGERQIEDAQLSPKPIIRNRRAGKPTRT